MCRIPSPSTATTRSAPGVHIRSAMPSIAPGTGWGQRRSVITSVLRYPCTPARPSASTAKRTRVRQPPVASAGCPAIGSTVISRSIPAMRRNCSATTAAFSARCAAGVAKEKSQQPAPPGPETGQVAGTRSGDASRISIASARQNEPPRSSVTRTRTSSSGSPCRTKTTRPSCRATQNPPCPGGPSRTWKVFERQSVTLGPRTRAAPHPAHSPHRPALPSRTTSTATAHSSP